MNSLPPIPNFTAFTVTADGGRLDRIITDIGVSFYYDSAIHSGLRPKIHSTKALWDTGATNSVVSKATALALGLVPSSMARMAHANGVSDVNGYLVNFYLPNHVEVKAVRVLEMEDKDEFGVLIGMDVIGFGDFAITNVNGITKVSFRIPSIAEIDYVMESQKLVSASKRDAGIGRNDLCPCGSGRKYKNCHGR